MRILKQILGTLACGYILMFYSEFAFWARLRPEDSLSGWVSTWLLYSGLAFVFLSLLARFRVRSAWALFLAGAVFGWLTEGLIVQTAYESLPLSISFTGLAWHALISVWVGWVAVRRAVHANLRSVMLISAAIGLLVGLWSISWWVQPDGGVAPPLDFAGYAFVTTLLLIPAYWLFDLALPALSSPNRLVGWVAVILLLLYFVFITIPAAPWAALILPVLLVAVLLTLRHNRQVEIPGSILDSTPGVTRICRYLGLLTLPVTATAFYTIAFHFSLRWSTHWVLYLLTTPAGFILLGIAMLKIWQRKTTVLKTG